MPVDKILIQEKIQLTDEYIKRIEEMHFNEKEFLENVDYQDMLTFRLQQAIELCIDIATHIISAIKLTKPETARSSFEVLENHKIITKKTAKQMMLAVSFRNIVVHSYEKFDFKALFHDYKDDMKTIRLFMGEILNFIA